MARTIIDLGAQRADPWLDLLREGAHTCWLPGRWGRDCEACVRREARLTQVRAESMWTRPMREARTLDLANLPTLVAERDAHEAKMQRALDSLGIKEPAPSRLDQLAEYPDRVDIGWRGFVR